MDTGAIVVNDDGHVGVPQLGHVVPAVCDTDSRGLTPRAPPPERRVATTVGGLHPACILCFWTAHAQIAPLRV